MPADKPVTVLAPTMAGDKETGEPPLLDVPLIVYVVLVEAPLAAVILTVAFVVPATAVALGCAIVPSATGAEEAVIALEGVDVTVFGDLVVSFAVTVNV